MQVAVSLCKRVKDREGTKHHVYCMLHNVYCIPVNKRCHSFMHINKIRSSLMKETQIGQSSKISSFFILGVAITSNNYVSYLN